ncbi:hypothetical protein AB0J35_62500 [Nonomuraea angiospora]|uniref:hypothetical protein n=1 Tax=Nonomuraea angiospora TaxID=46172 RepID=UPI0034489DA5
MTWWSTESADQAADDQAKASFTQFVGTPGYDAADLGSDIDRFTFLLGGDNGEHLLA